MLSNSPNTPTNSSDGGACGSLRVPHTANPCLEEPYALIVQVRVCGAPGGNIRGDLDENLKAIVEQAATHLGQTVNEFAAATFVRTAYDVIQQHERTRLSNRDHDVV